MAGVCFPICECAYACIAVCLMYSSSVTILAFLVFLSAHPHSFFCPFSLVVPLSRFSHADMKLGLYPLSAAPPPLFTELESSVQVYAPFVGFALISKRIVWCLVNVYLIQMQRQGRELHLRARLDRCEL